MRSVLRGAISVAAVVWGCFSFNEAEASALYNLSALLDVPFTGYANFAEANEYIDYGFESFELHITVSDQVLSSGETFTIKVGDVQIQASYSPLFDVFDFNGHTDLTTDVTGDLPGRTVVSLDFDVNTDVAYTVGSTRTYYGNDGASAASFTLNDADGVATFFSGSNMTGFVSVSLTPVPLPNAGPMLGAALLTLGAIGYGVRRRTALGSD